MLSFQIVFIGILVVVWWVGVWGIIETLIHLYAKGCPKKSLFIYCLLVSMVIGIIYLNPALIALLQA